MLASDGSWKSYASVSSEYERAATPFFGQLAAELVQLVAPARSDVVVDIGTGTGLVARASADALALPGFALGIDPSVEMLAIARNHGVPVIAGRAPGLPLRTDFADVAVANLVLSHIGELGAAMADIVRMLRPSGRFGATAWAEDREEPGDHGAAAHWIVGGVLDDFGLAVDAPERAAPREEWLRDEERLLRTFETAGLEVTGIEEREYLRSSTASEFFAGLEWGGGSRYLRSITDEATWSQLREAAVHALEHQFPGGIARIARVRFVIGSKSARP